MSKRLIPKYLISKTTSLHGAWIVFLGVVFLSPDALLLRVVQADDFTTSFWRMSLATLAFITVGVCMNYIKQHSFSDAIRTAIPNRMEVYCGLLITTGSLCFTFSVRSTDAANTLVIISSMPMMACIIGALIFRHPQSLLNWISSLIVLSAIFGMMMGDLKNPSLIGETLGLIAAFSMALYFNMVAQHPTIKPVRAIMFGTLIAALFMLPFAEPIPISAQDLLWLSVFSCFLFPLSFILITIGAKKIPAAEVGLIMLLELILGSVLVWIGVNEIPTTTTMMACFVVVVTLITHSLISMHSNKKVAK